MHCANTGMNSEVFCYEAQEVHTSTNNQEANETSVNLHYRHIKHCFCSPKNMDFAIKLNAVTKWDSVLEFQFKWIIMSIIMVLLMMLNDIHYELIWTCFRFGDDKRVLSLTDGFVWVHETKKAWKHWSWIFYLSLTPTDPLEVIAAGSRRQSSVSKSCTAVHFWQIHYYAFLS